MTGHPTTDRAARLPRLVWTVVWTLYGAAALCYLMAAFMLIIVPPAIVGIPTILVGACSIGWVGGKYWRFW